MPIIITKKRKLGSLPIRHRPQGGKDSICILSFSSIIKLLYMDVIYFDIFLLYYKYFIWIIIKYYFVITL